MTKIINKDFDKGMLHLIKQKLDHGNTPKQIEDMLSRAGFAVAEVKRAVKYLLDEEMPTHQREAAQNDFLPPLSKKIETKVVNNPGLDTQDFAEASQIVTAEITHKGLFKGRLRRKDFLMGVLFFFGLGFVFFSIMVTWVQILFPHFYNQVLAFVEQDSYGIWLMCVPFMFAPVTIIVLSLIVRRLHNLDLPGWIAFMYLFAFVSPFGAFGGTLLFAIHFVLLTLFIVLLTVKGHPAPNRHGELPSSAGSIFGHMFGYEHSGAQANSDRSKIRVVQEKSAQSKTTQNKA